MKTSGTNITEMGQHLAPNPTCSMSFEDFQVLAYENKMRKRHILESLYIQDYNHTFLIIILALYHFTLLTSQDGH